MCRVLYREGKKYSFFMTMKGRKMVKKDNKKEDMERDGSKEQLIRRKKKSIFCNMYLRWNPVF